MRQSWQFRLLGFFMLPLYAMGAWIAPALQVCPMHGSPAAALAGTNMSGMDMSAMDMSKMDMSASAPSTPAAATSAAHAGHSPNSPAARATPGAEAVADVQLTLASNTVAASDAPAGAHTHGCDCLGCCAGSNGPAVPVPQLALVAPASTGHEPVEMKNAEAVVTRLAHVLPFATAPPHALV